MTPEELEAELEPVRKYHRSAEISVNTVLAAHMRALGVVPNGDAWSLAKSALGAGLSFAEAARAGAGDGTTGLASDPRVGDFADQAMSTPRVTAATELTPARIRPGPLDWYPQRFDPGAMQGDGAKKLLGTPHVTLEDMLVRETAQNSWDARAGGEPVHFTMNLRDLPSSAVRLLRDEVFTGDARGTNLRDALATENLWVIEISDRGTVGLGGPVRNDKSVPKGEVTHFIDLVFNLGSTKNDPASGGTYGFGKSISYMVSEVGAIAIWSRCRTDAGIEDRFIASAIGDVFDMNGFRHTGRHWWGRIVDGHPEPLVGQPARELGERLFALGFEPEGLGTSLIILAPTLGAPGPDDDAEVLVQSVLWNLWPKLLADDHGHQPMVIRVQRNGVDVSIPDPATHSVLSGSVACLKAVRAVQEDKPMPASLFRTEVVPIQRYNEVLGHLALTKYPLSSRDLCDDDDGRVPSRSVTLMRHGAELVVRRLERQPLADTGFQWTGVFKPVAKLDATFAKSEPPAHDDWSYASLPNKVQRSQVKVALDKIARAADGFVSPNSDAADYRAAVSTAPIGDLLASFLGGVPGSAPSRRSGSAGGARSARPSLSVTPIDWAPAETPGWTRTTLRVEVSGGDPAGTTIRMKARVALDGGSEKQADPDFVQELGWLEDSRFTDVAVVRPGEPKLYVVASRDDIALDVSASVEVGAG